jgi:hypothetical protein
MTTIMTWETSGGKKGRCDARCHKAIHPKCACICGGRYHGSAHRPGGVEQAVKDTWEEAIQEAEAKAKAEGMELDTSRLRKFIGLEPANPAKADNLSTPGPTVREVEEVYRAEAIQLRLPLEVG